MNRNLSAEARANKNKYDNQYRREHFDNIYFSAEKGTKEKIKAHAAARGESVNAFINRAIAGQLKRDGSDSEADEDASN